MSVRAIDAVINLRGVSSSEKLVLLVLANYASPETGECFPSQRRFADDTGLTDRTLRNVFKALEDKGLMQRQERRRPNGSRRSDLIVLTFEGVTRQPETISACRPAQPEMVSGKAETVSALEPSGNRQKKPTPVGVGRARASRRCPSTYQPSDDLLVWSVSQGHPADLIEVELPKFRDHEFRSPRSDWDAAFRNWLRTSKGDRHERSRQTDHQAAGASDPRRANTDARRSAWADLAHERERSDPGDDGRGGGADGGAVRYLPRRAGFA